MNRIFDTRAAQRIPIGDSIDGEYRLIEPPLCLGAKFDCSEVCSDLHDRIDIERTNTEMVLEILLSNEALPSYSVKAIVEGQVHCTDHFVVCANRWLVCGVSILSS